MPQAIEWSLATPMISPRLPCISPCMQPSSRVKRSPSIQPDRVTNDRIQIQAAGGCPAFVRQGTMIGGPGYAAAQYQSRVEPLEDHRSVGAAETERVGQHTTKLGVVDALAHD